MEVFNIKHLSIQPKVNIIIIIINIIIIIIIIVIIIMISPNTTIIDNPKEYMVLDNSFVTGIIVHSHGTVDLIDYQRIIS